MILKILVYAQKRDSGWLWARGGNRGPIGIVSLKSWCFEFGGEMEPGIRVAGRLTFNAGGTSVAWIKPCSFDISKSWRLSRLTTRVL